MEKLSEISASFHSMNTGVEIVLCLPPGLKVEGEKALQKIQLLFKQVEETLSRFNPKSELSRLNSAAGSLFVASPWLFKVIAASLEAARDTGGLFDPAILPELIACGYDRSFEKLIERTVISQSNMREKKHRWTDIKLDARSSSIFMPRGCSLDLGGIGKGWTVDKACADLDKFDNFAVDAGGDIRAKGKMADGSPWRVGIADPFNADANLMAIDLPGGAICTSTTTHRKWEIDGRPQHHLIDPRSGKPAQSGVASASILAESAARAEIISKTALILGPEAGRRFIEEQPGVCGLLVTDDKLLVYSKGFKELVYAA